MIPSTLSRQEIIDRLMWVDENMRMYPDPETFLDPVRKVRGRRDWKSIVFVVGPIENYTTEELADLLKFSEKVTAEIDEKGWDRMGTNKFYFQKMPDGRCRRDRTHWTQGSFFSDSVKEAVEFMSIVFD